MPKRSTRSDSVNIIEITSIMSVITLVRESYGIFEPPLVLDQ